MKEKGFDSSRVPCIRVITFYLFILLLFTASALSGCIEEYEADISTEDSDLLVVEGTICSHEMNTFVLSRTQAISSFGITQMVQGARLSVLGSDGSEYHAYPGYGFYSCWVDSLSPDVDYYLHIETDGEVYETEPQKPLPTESIAEVIGVQNTPESNIDVLVTPEEPFEDNQTKYYSWTYDETWQVYPEYTNNNVYFDLNLMKPVFKTNMFPEYGWKDDIGTTINVGASINYEGQHIRRLKIYDIDRSDERVYHRYSGLIHQRAISKAEYEYELARRQAGSEMGGLFTPQPSALPTNIHCLTSKKHVIGYVGCSLNRAERRFFLNAKDFSIYHPRHDALIWFDDTSMNDCIIMVNRGLYLCVWQDERPWGKLKTGWAYEYQLDVRLQGAYIEEPYFWSLE